MIAFLPLGNKSLESYPAGNSYALDGFVKMAEVQGPKLQAKGYKRLLIHLPGGAYDLDQSSDDDRVMHVNCLDLAKQAGATWADTDELLVAHRMFIYRFGLEEVIYYVGEPGEVKPKVLEAALDDYLALGPGASLAFDHVSMPGANEGFNRATDYCHSQGFCGRYYGEAWMPPAASPASYQRISGVMATTSFLKIPGVWPDYLAHAARFGEVIVMSRSVDDSDLAPYGSCTRCERGWLR